MIKRTDRHSACPFLLVEILSSLPASERNRALKGEYIFVFMRLAVTPQGMMLAASQE